MSTTTTDFVPQSFENLAEWLALQQSGVTLVLATAIGASAAEHTAFQAAVTASKTPLDEVVALRQQIEAKIAALRPILDTQLPVVRAFISRGKTSPGCTGDIKVTQQWLGEQHEIDYGSQRPKLRIEVQRGQIKIAGQKPGFDAVNIYSRKKGEVEWKLICTRLLKFPFYDERPLAVPGTPEVREYMAVGVVDNEETGQPSEIKEVVYAG